MLNNLDIIINSEWFNYFTKKIDVIFLKLYPVNVDTI